MGFPTIRITGFDCDALERASVAAANHGLQVLAGIYVQVLSSYFLKTSLVRDGYHGRKRWHLVLAQSSQCTDLPSYHPAR